MFHNKYNETVILGYPITRNDTTRPTPIGVPGEWLTEHIAVLAPTGAGKTALAGNMIGSACADLDTGGLLINPKDRESTDTFVAGLLEHGVPEEDIVVFDAARTPPALNLLQITPDRTAHPRTVLVSEMVELITEQLEYYHSGGFGTAESAVRVLRNALRFAYDPTAGSDMPTLADAQDVLTELLEHGELPPATDEHLRESLEADATSDEFSTNVLKGARDRLKKITDNKHMRPVFCQPAPAETTLVDAVLDGQVVVVDLVDLEGTTQTVLTAALLTSLWQAVRRRRSERGDYTPIPLLIDEAPKLAPSRIYSKIATEGRGFGLGLITLAQHPDQYGTGVESETSHTGQELVKTVLTESGTIVASNIALSQPLCERFAGGDLTPEAVASRLKTIRKGRWLVTMRGDFETNFHRPFYVEAPAPPLSEPD